jgi:hypothetical protein
MDFRQGAMNLGKQKKDLRVEEINLLEEHIDLR